MVRHNETGYIAEFGDTSRMAKYVIDLLTNDKKFNAFSKNARLRAIEHFDKKIIVPQYEKYYEEILNQD